MGGLKKLKISELFKETARYADVEDNILRQYGQDAWLSFGVVCQRALDRKRLVEARLGWFQSMPKADKEVEA